MRSGAEGGPRRYLVIQEAVRTGNRGFRTIRRLIRRGDDDTWERASSGFSIEVTISRCATCWPAVAGLSRVGRMHAPASAGGTAVSETFCRAIACHS